MRVLFVCNQNQNRSKTAEALFSTRFNTKSAGLYNENPLEESQLRWADLVVVMEDSQRKEIASRFPGMYLQRRIVSLNVPDVYRYGQKELEEALKSRMSDIF